MTVLQMLTTSPIHFFLKGWENVLFELWEWNAPYPHQTQDVFFWKTYRTFHDSEQNELQKKEYMNMPSI